MFSIGVNESPIIPTGLFVTLPKKNSLSQVTFFTKFSHTTGGSA